MSVVVNSIVADSDRNFFYNLVGGSATRSLFIDFTTGSLDSKITFSRSSSATRVNSSGYIESVGANTARFDYSPVSLTLKGLLVEGATTNLLLWSDDVRGSSDSGGHAEWVQTPDANVNVILDTTVTNPYGVLSTCKVRCSVAGAVQRQISQTLTLTDGTLYTSSIYIKAGECTFMKMGLTSKDASVSTIVYNLSTGTVQSASGTQLIESGIIPSGNGWYRCWATWSAASGATTPTFAFSLAASGGADFNGNTTEGFYAFGAQTEAGQGATSLIPTTTAAVARSADVVSITGTNFSSWFSQLQGTFVVEAYAATTVQNTAASVIEVNDNTSANRHIVYRENTNQRPHATAYNTSVSVADLTTAANTWVNGAKARIGYSYSPTKYQLSINGATPINTSASSLPGTLDRLRIGDNSSGTRPLNGCITKIEFYNASVFDSGLSSITT